MANPITAVSSVAKKKKSSSKHIRSSYKIFRNILFSSPSNTIKSPDHREAQLHESEREIIISILGSHIEDTYGISLNMNQIIRVLENQQWDLQKALEYTDELFEANEGIILDRSQTTVLLGAENDQGTSCYIDSTLFAMFISPRAFDALLHIQPDPTNLNRSRLQTSLRLFVNQLRSGKLISATAARDLRKDLVVNGWPGYDTMTGSPVQGDAAELFLFLTELYQLPYLPFESRLLHGADFDNNDDKFITERIIQLAIPTKSNAAISLEEVLSNHFYNNVVTDLRRAVGGEEKSKENITVSAWQVLSFFPFYSSTNEQGDSVLADRGLFNEIIIPLALKRYTFDEYGSSYKIKKAVFVPHEINFSNFVQQTGDALCECGSPLQYRLRLKAVVCHEGGESVNSGHYVAFAADGEDAWLQFDDLHVESRVTRLTRLEDITRIFEHFATNGYLLFYELHETHSHEHILKEGIEMGMDEAVAQKLHVEQLAGIVQQRKNCNIL